MGDLNTYTRSFTVASGATSGAVELEDWDTLGLIFPTMTSSTMKLQVSPDGVTYYDVYDQSGTQVLNWAANTGLRAVASRDMADVCGYPWMALICGTAQGALRTLTLTFKAPKRR